MTYNMSFQFAALAIMLVIFYHFSGQNLLNNDEVIFFRVFLLTSLADVVLDIVTTPLLSVSDPSIAPLSLILLTAFYFLQVSIAFLLFAYAQRMRRLSPAQQKRILMVFGVLPIAMAIVILCNLKTGWLFSFDASGVYHRGAWYYLTYIYGVTVALITAITAVRHYAEIGKTRFFIIIEFVFLEALSTAIQAVTGSLLLTAFGIGLGVMVLYLTINNPIAYMDNLTGFYDRQYFDSWIRYEIRQKRQMHLISVNAAMLGQVNRVYGSSVGDRLLVMATEMLRQISGSNKAFRMTEDTFLVVVDTVGQYERTLKQVENYFQKPVQAKDDVFRFPAVICGIKNAEDFHDADTLFSYVEYMTALSGKTDKTVVIRSDERVLEGYRYECEVERYLRTALDEDLFEVRYQPLWSFQEDRFICAEALSRLKHPTLGMIPPDVIFSVAEKLGIADKIGILQFQRICRFVREHPEITENLNNIKFNLSPAELLRMDYCRELIRIIHQNGISASFFQVEITETTATEYYNETLWSAVRLFQDEGIELCLDDFGSGYANLDTVLRLPFSTVKMDSSLLRGICTDELSAMMYQSIVLMMRNMGYRVVSEGVENQIEAERLRSWDVDMIQGFYYARPLSEDKLLETVMGGVQPVREDTLLPWIPAETHG